MEYRVSAGVTLLVGILLIGGSFVFFPHNGQDGCWNSVELIDDTEISERHGSVTQYSHLSGDAKHAFDKARTSGDNSATVYGDRCPDGLSYSDGNAYYAIEKSDTYYELETAADSGGLYPIDAVLNWVLLVSGAVSLLLGSVTLYRRDDMTFRQTRRPFEVVDLRLALEFAAASVGALLLLPITVAIPLVPLLLIGLIAYRQIR